MVSVPATGFYVYVLSRPDGTPFYVGKGAGGRATRHTLEAKRGHKCPKCSVIRKIIAQGGSIEISVVFETLNQNEALDYEIALIAELGRDSLTNLTDGGEGRTGSPHSPETRRKIREAMQGRVFTAEWRQKLSRAAKGKPKSAEAREKTRLAATGRLSPLKGTTLSTEHKAKISAAMKERAKTHKPPPNPMRGKKLRPEHVEKIRVSVTAWHAERRERDADGRGDQSALAAISYDLAAISGRSDS